jgi:hypothetical protein
MDLDPQISIYFCSSYDTDMNIDITFYNDGPDEAEGVRRGSPMHNWVCPPFSVPMF